jgi:hypothetical protein
LHCRVSGELRFIGAPDPDPVPVLFASALSALIGVAFGRRRLAGPHAD